MKADKLIKLFEKAGILPDRRSRVLDFGCGAGEAVTVFRNAGYDCEGCDIEFKDGIHVKALEGQGLIKRIPLDPYKLPYHDGSFDFAFSSQVFEHVMDYESTLSELARILKPGSVCFHTFPSKWRLCEAHTGTPLGGVFQSRYWIAFWAMFGINKRNPKHLKAREIARLDYEYLTTRTNYLSASDIRRVFEKYHFRIGYINAIAVGFSSNRFVGKFLSNVPGIDVLTRCFVARFIVTNLEKED
jgi:SAM-dependent methyltransferase